MGFSTLADVTVALGFRHSALGLALLLGCQPGLESPGARPAEAPAVTHAASSALASPSQALERPGDGVGVQSIAIAPTQLVAALVVDDFETPAPSSTNPMFMPWERYTYNPPGQRSSFRLVPGHNSGRALALSWQVTDPLNGKQDHPGAGLRARASNDFVNLATYTRLLFSHRYAALIPSTAQHSVAFAKDACRPITQFFVFVVCREFDTQFEAFVPVSEEWKTEVLPLSELHEPTWKPPTGTSLQQCLAAADALSFAAQSDLRDGECSKGTLAIDSIAFR